MTPIKTWIHAVALPLVLGATLVVGPVAAEPAPTDAPAGVVKEIQGGRRAVIRRKNRQLQNRKQRIQQLRGRNQNLRVRNNRKSRRIAALRGRLRELRRVDNQRYQALMAALSHAASDPSVSVSVDNQVVVPPSPTLNVGPITVLVQGDQTTITQGSNDDGTTPGGAAPCAEDGASCQGAEEPACDGNEDCPDDDALGEDEAYDRGHEDGRAEVSEMVFARLRDDAQAGRSPSPEAIQALLRELGYEVEVADQGDAEAKSWMTREGATLQDSVD